jgi:hypothetical protein
MLLLSTSQTPASLLDTNTHHILSTMTTEIPNTRSQQAIHNPPQNGEAGPMTILTQETTEPLSQREREASEPAVLPFSTVEDITNKKVNDPARMDRTMRCTKGRCKPTMTALSLGSSKDNVEFFQCLTIHVFMTELKCSRNMK